MKGGKYSVEKVDMTHPQHVHNKQFLEIKSTLNPPEL